MVIFEANLFQTTTESVLVQLVPPSFLHNTVVRSARQKSCTTWISIRINVDKLALNTLISTIKVIWSQFRSILVLFLSEIIILLQKNASKIVASPKKSCAAIFCTAKFFDLGWDNLPVHNCVVFRTRGTTFRKYRSLDKLEIRAPKYENSRCNFYFFIQVRFNFGQNQRDAEYNLTCQVKWVNLAIKWLESALFIHMKAVQVPLSYI